MSSFDLVAERLVARVEARGEGSCEDLRAHCAANAASLRDALVRSGALLFRGFAIESSEQYLSIVRALGLAQMSGPPMLNKVLASATPQAAEQGTSKDATIFVLDRTAETKPDQLSMQGPHTELGWRSRRPRFLSFWADLPSPVGGETALFDMARAYEELDRDLRDAFDRHLSSYPAQGQGAFWEERYAVDSVLVQPETGRRCLVIWYFRDPLVHHAIAAYRATAYAQRHPLEAQPYLGTPRFRPLTLEHTLVGEGGRRMVFTPEQKARLMRTVYACAEFVPWRARDVLVVDNVRLAHARMQSTPPRRLAAAMWDEFDARTISANRALTADDCPSFKDVEILPVA